ncbi:hypothetical protein B296_00046134 [Ensete ventricosum]|uniref:valine--tRNA ligase n=1 Tax=Ensete ventricosum TaxID=4639 RepID=A0A426X6R8_ENSVE|nr:hypothetical protein B296_00046134 [Ensete ventricosum]
MVSLTSIPQVAVEKKLMRENKVTRHDIGRQRFIYELVDRIPFFTSPCPSRVATWGRKKDEKRAVHPFNGRKLPVICDDNLVNFEYGTGAVKVRILYMFKREFLLDCYPSIFADC